jgi:hypothetical protein
LTPTADCRTSTESGISIEEQHSEGIEYRNRSFDGESNVNDCNPSHIPKHNSPMVSVELGIQIDLSEHQANADFPICESVEPDSKATMSSALQATKQLVPISLTPDGIQIDFSDEQ